MRIWIQEISNKVISNIDNDGAIKQVKDSENVYSLPYFQ